jgi:hypothetical protein
VRTLSDVFAAIIGLDFILLGMLGAAGAMSRRRAWRSAGRSHFFPGTERLRLVPAPTRRSLGSRMTSAALPAAVVFAGVALVAGGLHLMPAPQKSEVLGSPRRQQPRFHDGRSRTGPRTATSAPKGPLSHRSSDGAGRSAGPNEAGAETMHAASPSVVTAVSVSATEIEVSWTDVRNETGYRIERSTSAAQGWVMIATTPPGATTYNDAGLPSGATYFYRVVATGLDGPSVPSDVASSTTIPLPPSPGALTAITASSSEIDLSWADVVNETGFRIERSSDGVTGWVSITTTGQGVTLYSDGALTPDTTYYYRVFATDAGGDSLPSDVVSSVTAADTSSPSSTP